MESAFLKIINAKVLTPSGLLPNGQIIISDGKIVEITGQNREIPHAEIIDAKGYYVAPGCIDTHVHGGNGHDFTEATPKAFYAITRAHALQGTTALYPTLAAAPIDTFREAIKTCEHIMNHPEQGARIMGLHLEGNYLNMAMKGGQDPNYIYPPNPQEYKELLNSTQCIKRWSAAPELDGALEFGKYASAHGVLVSLAHTTADYLQVKKAYEAGFTHATHFYNALKNPQDETPVSYGLNSRLVKEDGKIQEKVWKVGGLYGQALEKIVYWLKKAEGVAETPEQKAVIAKLMEFYETGDLKTFDEYAILWVKDLNSRIDFVNGFTESYGDPLGMKASWESLVNFKDLEATQRTELISGNAQWFEDHSPVDGQFKKEKVKGVSAKVITAAILAGDLYPATAIGINLPNANWIRSHHGSKSVTIGNITDAYNKAAHGNGFNEEFVYSDAELQLIDKYADVTDELHTDLHECLGHGSGKLLPGVDPDALKAYGSTIEEARADLFGLYYVADPKLVELGLTPSADAYKAQYYTYLMNGLMTQLVRIEPGNNVEEAHMRNRQLIARWVYEKGAAEKVVELVKKDGKTYVVINDYEKVRDLFGRLLAEIQRIKSTGDYAGAHDLVEAYAVKVDPALHAEVLERYKKLNLAPYKGFVNPKYEVVTDADGTITDVTVTYDEGYAEQMLRYSKDYSTLPSVNK